MDCFPPCPLLDGIDSPAALRALPEVRLGELARELRACTIASAAISGGHFAANLGVIELTVALHYLYDTPHDRLVWDVGHQCYPHKILTARRDRITTIKRRGGLAPFTSPEESPFDAFTGGHAGNSIGAALGMALTDARLDPARRTVAVIGDGALGAGMAFEALNHAGGIGADLLVILNDNGMSIDANVGALAQRTARNDPGIGPQAFFRSLGFACHGPVDGHDLPTLLAALRALRDQRGPRFLHLRTTKGKGYAPAEADPVGWHATGPFDPTRSAPHRDSPTHPTWSEVFGDWLCDMAAAEPALVAITPAMREGSGLTAFAHAYPDRFFDVGIAEQHAVTLAAGLAAAGAKPVLAIYSTFLQRGLDQLIHDVALPGLDVTLAIDRAGLVGPDGPTHAGSFDLSLLRAIPNLVIMAPADGGECRRLLSTAFHHQGLAAVRYPRGATPGLGAGASLEPLPLGRAELRRQGSRIAILAFGAMLTPAHTAAQALDATLANMRFVKPLDETLLRELAAGHAAFVTVEDNAIAGGAGSAVAEALHALGIERPLLQLGLPDRFIAHATREEQLAEVGLDAAGIEASVRRRFGHLLPRLRSAG